MSVTKKHRVIWVFTAFLLSVLLSTAYASPADESVMTQGVQMPCESESDHPVGAQQITDTDNHACASHICQCATQGCHLTLIAFDSPAARLSLSHPPALLPLRQNLLDAGPHRLDRPPRS